MIFNNNFYSKCFLVLQCGFALLACDKAAVVSKQITLEQLYAELRQEPEDFFRHHIGLMWTISGYGDSLYNVTKKVAERCVLISGATQAMLEQLRICEDTYLVVQKSITEARVDIMNAQPVEHPLKYLCRRTAISYSQKPHLSTAFNLAKLLTRIIPKAGRPAYSDELITSLAAMGRLLDSWATIPELARSMANAGFRNQLNERKAYTPRHHLLVKIVFEIVRRDEELADMMQDVYETMLSQILPQITTNATAKSLTLADGKTFWFFPRMMRMFYQLIVKDDVLMQEFNNTAAILGKNLDKAYLDFSQI